MFVLVAEGEGGEDFYRLAGSKTLAGVNVALRSEKCTVDGARLLASPAHVLRFNPAKGPLLVMDANGASVQNFNGNGRVYLCTPAQARAIIKAGSAGPVQRTRFRQNIDPCCT